MIITISGKAGTGKSTVAKAVAKKLHYKHYSVGDLMRQMAQKKGISLVELSKLAEKSDEIDRELDKMQIELGRKEDNFVIDCRLGALFIPKSFKIYLACDDDLRVKRIFNDKRASEQTKDIKELKKEILARESSERKRYKSYYDFDYHDKKHYDLVFDTTDYSIEQTAGKIIKTL
jgi:cytidylate kinase